MLQKLNGKALEKVVGGKKFEIFKKEKEEYTTYYIYIDGKNLCSDTIVSNLFRRLNIEIKEAEESNEEIQLADCIIISHASGGHIINEDLVPDLPYDYLNQIKD